MADNEAIGLGETLVDTATPSSIPAPATGQRPALGLTMRSTVLPRLVAGAPAGGDASKEPRFEPVRLLGQGGIGEVTLVRDNDIDRPVALKRLRGVAQSEEGLYRFVHEIRTVGQLEHPNIAPIHDVGIDDHGQHYFVMRYVEGETLETIISKLAAGDPAYHRRFTFEHRAQIFLGILNAISYAHSKQIIHRDIKPSNIMVGPYGEVVVMDWGIAKKKSAPESRDAAALADTHDAPPGQTQRDSMFRTRHGSLVGTPAYMSPEQAAGHTDAIDERSDIYSLCVVFYELLSLQHYLPGRTTVHEMLASVQKDRHAFAFDMTSPHQLHVPAELAWFLQRGLEKDPARRYASVEEMISELQLVLSGGFAVRCYITFMKRNGNRMMKLADRHPRVMVVGMAVWTALAVAGIAAVLLHLLG